MTKNWKLLGMLGVGLPCLFGQAPSEAAIRQIVDDYGRLSVTLSTNQTVYFPGEEFKFSLRATNPANRVLTVPVLFGPPMEGFQYDIEDQDGSIRTYKGGDPADSNYNIFLGPTQTVAPGAVLTWESQTKGAPLAVGQLVNM